VKTSELAFYSLSDATIKE